MPLDACLTVDDDNALVGTSAERMPEQHTKRISCHLQKPRAELDGVLDKEGRNTRRTIVALSCEKLFSVERSVVRPGCAVGDRRPPWPPRRRHWRYCETGDAICGSLCMCMKLMGKVLY